MKKTGFVVLALVSLSSMLAHSAELTAENLVNKIIDAQGGRAALKNVKDSTFLGSVELTQMGTEGALRDYWKQPAKRRADFDLFGMTLSQAFDGAHAWMNNPQAGGIQDLPAQQKEAFARGALGHSVWLDPQKHGITYSLGGSALDEPGYYSLIQSFPSGHSNLFLVDKTTFLVSKMRSKTLDPSGAEIKTELTLSDYRTVGSTVYPYSLVSSRGGEQFSITLLDEIKLNTGIEDSFFTVPSEQSASVDE